MESKKNKDSHFRLLQENKGKLFAGSESLMRECIELFCQNSTVILEKIEEGIVNSDFPKVAAQANKLNGILKLFSDESSITLCKKLETKAVYNQAGELQHTYTILREEIYWLRNSLHEYRTRFL